MNDFFKFPSTPHLAVLQGVDVRGDKVMSEEERSEFLRHEITVEEKIDGANLGISFDGDGNLRLQNRGGIVQLPGQGQWKKLEEWLTSRIDTLFEHLEARLILFGEWCYAKHTVFYRCVSSTMDLERTCLLWKYDAHRRGGMFDGRGT